MTVVIIFSMSFTTAPAAAEPESPSPYWVQLLRLDRAWALSQGDHVTVGLVDTGVDAGEPDLAGAVLPGAEFPDLGAGTADGQGHGTTMALLITGVAPQAKILPVRLDGGAADANDAIRWVVDHGAKVVNLSLGNGVKNSAAYDDGLRYAKEHDVVVVAAAGNVATDPGVTSPADRPGVLTVSAVDRTGRFRGDVSVQGSEITLVAPGVDITTSRTGETGPTSGTSQAAAALTVTGTAEARGNVWIWVCLTIGGVLVVAAGVLGALSRSRFRAGTTSRRSLV